MVSKSKKKLKLHFGIYLPPIILLGSKKSPNNFALSFFLSVNSKSKSNFNFFNIKIILILNLYDIYSSSYLLFILLNLFVSSSNLKYLVLGLFKFGLFGGELVSS